VHLVGFITKKIVTMHGHMNVKNGYFPLNLLLSGKCPTSEGPVGCWGGNSLEQSSSTGGTDKSLARPTSRSILIDGDYFFWC